MVPVRKKEDIKPRWTCDYRDLNACTVSDAFPLPDITNNLQQLSGSSVFTTLDSAGAFHAIPVEEESRDVTAFVCPRGQFRYRRMPFGVKNGPATYSRLIETAVQKLPPGFTLSYLDDLIIYSPDYASHLQHLRQVLHLHVELGLKLKLKKCHIAKREVQYLGHCVSSAGISMVKEYVERILAWPSPKTPADLRSFLGVAGYYRAFIPQYAELAAPLDGIKNKRTLDWSEDLEKQFQLLKEAFISAPSGTSPTSLERPDNLSWIRIGPLPPRQQFCTKKDRSRSGSCVLSEPQQQSVPRQRATTRLRRESSRPSSWDSGNSSTCCSSRSSW